MSPKLNLKAGMEFELAYYKIAVQRDGCYVTGILLSLTLCACVCVFDRTGWNDKMVVLKKTTLQLYLKTFIEKINSAKLIM